MFAEDSEKLIVIAADSSDEILNPKLNNGGEAAAVSDYLDISPFLAK